MQITRRTDYAIHLIAELAKSPGTPLGLRILAERHKVTYAFARTVQQGLQQAGILAATRGTAGGLRLAKSLEEITMLEVFEAAQDPLCVAFGNDAASWCSCKSSCVSDSVWQSTQRVLHDHFSSISMHNVLSNESS